MDLYLAAPLFTQAERSWNLKLAALLSAAGHSVFLPQAEILALETLDAETIFRVDVDGVRSSDAVVAVLDGADPDSGTSFECGLAFALGIPIVLVRTDFRAGGDALPGQKLATVNLMLAQAASGVVNLPSPLASLDELATEVVRVLESLPEASHPVERLRP
jgi:nucleoside 2-deoxyribosyltransferase